MPQPRVKPVNEKPKKTKIAALARMKKLFEEEQGTWQEGEILHLDGWRTIEFKEAIDRIIVLAELITQSPRSCSTCKLKFINYGSTKILCVRDVPFHFKPIEIHFMPQRYFCKNCRVSLQQPSCGIHPHHKMTGRLVEHIERESLSLYKNFFDIKRETRIDDRTIRKIFTDCAERLEKSAQIETPSWLAVDEVYTTKNKQLCSVVTDSVGKKVLNLIKRDKAENFKRWLMQLPEKEKVEVVTMDLCPVYRAAVNWALPNAKIVADRFHVQNLLNKSLKDVLAIIRARLTVTDHKEYMRRHSLLLKSRHYLSEEASGRESGTESETIDKWLRDLPALGIAYELKEEFSDILQLSSREVAEQRADSWFMRISDLAEFFAKKYEKQCQRLNKHPFENVIETFGRWRSEILNYIDYKHKFPIKVTNAFAEMTNGKIKDANRLGKGYNFEVLRDKLLRGPFLKSQISSFTINYSEQEKSLERTSENRDDNSKSRDSNLVRLKKARESRDKTKDLIEKPQENPEWIDRFPDEQNTRIYQRMNQKNLISKTEDSSSPKPDESDTGQMKLF